MLTTKAWTAAATAVITFSMVLAASSSGVASGSTTGLPATQEATALALSATPKVVRLGDGVSLKARLTTTADDQPVSGETVVVQWKRGGTTNWRELAGLTTGQGGRVEWLQRPHFSGQFRAVFAGSATYDDSRSSARTVSLQPSVRVRLTKNWVRSAGHVKLKGEVAPTYKGERVSLQRRFDGGWRTVAKKRQGGKGRFAFRVGGTDRLGPAKYRVKLEGRDIHLSATSRVKKLTTVRLVTYRVETRGRIVVDMKKFKKRAQEIYNDRRGWSRAYVHFKRVRSGGAFSLVLSQASYVPSFAPICSAYWSCRAGRYVVINQNRWRWGTPYFKKAGGSLSEYRAMVVNHETGHWFGLGHASCGKAGARAPVMMQQSKGLNGCKPNPWPLPGEIARIR